MKPIPSVNCESHFICKATRASLGGDEQPPPLLTSRAPFQLRVPAVHNVIIVLLPTGGIEEIRGAGAQKKHKHKLGKP